MPERCAAFAPVVDARTRLLILGSLPGIEVAGGEVQAVHVSAGSGEDSASNDVSLKADAVVVACGSAACEGCMSS